MADLPPLDFDLSGTPFGQTGNDPLSKVLQAFRDNQARRTAWQRANGVTPEMLQQANRFGASAPAAAAPSTPLPENAAPVATAEAAAAPSFGARVAAGAGRAGLYGSLLAGGYEAGKLLIPDKMAVGLADMAGTVARKFGFNNGYADGSGQYAAAAARGDMASTAPAQTPVAPAPAPVASPLVNPAITQLSPDAATAATKLFFDGSAVPADGTGYIRNSSTGSVTALDSSNAPAARVRGVPAAPADVAPATPRLGTNGGVFGNLANYVNDYADTTLGGVASKNAATKNVNKQITLNTQANDAAAKSQVAQARTTAAYAEMLKALTGSQTSGTKVVTGLDGNPIVVDTKAGTAKKITPTERPTLDKFMTEARKDSRNKAATDDQLKAYYQRTYGG